MTCAWLTDTVAVHIHSLTHTHPFAPQVWRTVTLGAIMGVKDFNERNSRYVSEMGSTAMGACDIQINPTM